MNFEKIKTLYAITQHPSNGFEESLVGALEAALGYRLPEKLRQYYLDLGRVENLNFSHNRLLKPGAEIGFTADRYLVFYEENQGVAYWGIREEDLDMRDPPVYGNYNVGGHPDWQREANTTSDFLLLMAVYNGTFGGLQFNANSFEPVSKETIAFIQTQWEEVRELSYERQKIYTNDFKEVISISFDEAQNATGIFIGTSERENFDELLGQLDIDWSYTSYEDWDDET